LNALKVFPPFENNSFYTKARPMMVGDLDLSGMQDERFLFFDVWQKAVANLSAHIPQEGEFDEATEKTYLEEHKITLAEEATKFVDELRKDIDSKKVYASRIEKPLTHGCTNCAFKHPDLEGPSDFCSPFHNFCRVSSKVEGKDVEKAYVYIVKKNPKYVLEKCRRFNKELAYVGGPKVVNAFHHDFKTIIRDTKSLNQYDIVRCGDQHRTLLERMNFWEKNNMQYKNFNSATILIYSYNWDQSIGKRKFWLPIHAKLLDITH